MAKRSRGWRSKAKSLVVGGAWIFRMLPVRYWVRLEHGTWGSSREDVVNPCVV